MAYITVNETGTFPALILSTDVAGSNVGAGGNGFLAGTYISNDAANTTLLNVTCLQDVTVTNSTGIFSWTDFCSASINKVTTPSDNEISTNIVVDQEGFFGANASTNTSASYYGVSGLSQNRVEVAFRLQLNNSNTISNTAPAGNNDAGQPSFIYHGKGYLSSVAPTVSPDSPVWVSPLTIAVSGDMGSGPKVV
jgi:hypothetical protein